MAPNSTSSEPLTSIIGVYCERAITLMRNQKVQPTPRNYSVYYAYAAGQPTALYEELHSAMGAQEAISDGFLEHLYTKYLGQQQSRLLQETAQDAKKIISNVIRGIEDFSGSTRAAGQDIGSQIDILNTMEAVDQTMRNIAETVLRGAQVMQQSSNTVNEQLARAQEEILVLRGSLAMVTTESERDFLTGCYNRKAFDRIIQETVEESQSAQHPLTLLMLDIDHFKHFNDTHGHLIGDEVLKFVAKTVTDTVKGKDVVARYGGEEFTVILPNTPISGGLVVAEAIRKNVSSKELKRKSTGEPYGHVTVSIGVASLKMPQDSAYNLIKRADEAMYRSKHAGRDCVSKENRSA